MRICVYGAGGFGREVAWLAEACGHEVACFIDDAVDGEPLLNGFPVLRLEDARTRFADAPITCAVGSPRGRAAVAARARAAGAATVSLIHPRVERSRWVTAGDGAVICAGTILTTNITLGEQVQINLDCTIGHDVVMGDFTTLAPGVHVSGWVHFGRRCYVGTGAVLINGTQDEPLVVGDDATIGAGACVTRSVAAGTTVVGVPAKARP